MPRRLRVAFVASQNLTLAANTGSFVRTGVAATLTYVPTAVIADTWTKISGPYGNGDVRGGPNINQGWTKAAMDTLTGRVFLSQGYPAQGVNAGTFFFNPSLGYWERTNTVSNDWHRNMGAIAENYDITFDPDRNCFWRSSGSPFGGNPNIPAGQDVAGPWRGDGKYNVATDEWSTPYPSSDSAWVPLPGDTGYFGTPGNSLTGFDSAYKYYNGAIYQFGHFSVGGSQSLRRRDIATGVITTLAAYPAVPPMTQDSRTPHLRSGFDTRTKQLWTCANQMAYWVYDLTKASPAWEAITTTGTLPTVPPPTGSSSSLSTDFGMLACIDEAANCLVAWCGKNVVASDSGINKRTTWIMDLATRVWRLGPNIAAGHTVPPGEVAVKQSLLYDPVGRRTILAVGVDFATQVWALQIAPIGGKITSWALPTSSGSTYGTNYYGFPFTANGSCKHVNMGYCPLDGRLYATGGDSIHSATNGTWSMSLVDGSWRLDVAEPVYPTLVAPNSYQDGCIMQWMPSRNKFVFGFGGVFGYSPAGDPIYNYSSGYWFYDPVGGDWEQQVGFFTNPTLAASVVGTNCEYGGVYDDTTDSVYVLGDSANGFTARRYNLTTVALTTYAYSLPPSGISGFTAAYFIQSRPVIYGRYVYALGYYTNGVNRAPANCKAAMWRWGIDDHTFTRMADPPVFTQNVDQKELVLAVSNGKLVHPRRYGPEGAMPEGIHIYNPANNTWTTDTKTPAYGAWIHNSVTELPDGRIAMSGGVFGSQQTHMWFYEAT